MTTGAIRTDFILSAEIMVIALNEVADQPFVPRLIILVVVALVITVAVYGVVAAHRQDGRRRPAAWPSARRDSRRGSAAAWSPGCPSCWRRCRPSARSAMLWVGGHILLVGTDTSAGTRRTAWSTTARSTCTTPSEGVGGVLGLAGQHRRRPR